jgi:3-methylcrotonyl-CoA carboxylase beta subunit
MPVIETRLNTRDALFAQNRDAMAALVADLREKIAHIEQGGGAAPSARHTARGKLLPRERVRALLDPTLFLEFSQLAAYGMYMTTSLRPESLPASAASQEQNVQRRHGQGRHLPSADVRNICGRRTSRAKTACRHISVDSGGHPFNQHDGFLTATLRRIFYNQATMSA